MGGEGGFVDSVFLDKGFQGGEDSGVLWVGDFTFMVLGIRNVRVYGLPVWVQKFCLFSTRGSAGASTGASLGYVGIYSPLLRLEHQFGGRVQW